MKLIEIYCVYVIIFFGKKWKEKCNFVRIVWCYVENCFYFDIFFFDFWVFVILLVWGILGNLSIII